MLNPWQAFAVIATLFAVSFGLAYLFARLYHPEDTPSQRRVRLMRGTMGWALVFFALPKLMDISGFARAFARYDLVAGANQGYGYVYPFVELTLGLALLLAYDATLVLPAAYSVLIVVMTSTLMGVTWHVFGNRAAGAVMPCGCLGTTVSMPLTLVTAVEGVAMIGMGGYLLMLDRFRAAAASRN